MTITELIRLLQNMRDRYGDVVVTFLDDESGNYEPVAAGFYVQAIAGGQEQLQLMTKGQVERDGL